MLGPFDLTGPAFLQLYLILLVMTVIAGLVIPYWLKPEGHDAPLTQTDDLAYLAGGRGRFAEAVTTRLLTSGKIVFDGSKKFAVAAVGSPANDTERSVLALGGSPNWSAVQRTLAAQAQPVEKRLVGAGLLIDDALGWQMRFWQTLPYLLLLAFGTIKLQIGMARDKPVGFLTALLIATSVFALIRFGALDRRTRGGRRVLAKARATSERVKRAPTNDEAALGVALFGTAILAGSDWAPFHRMRVGNGDGGGGCGSSDGGSSGGDGGGGGGGGCGGCGGS